MHLYGVNFASTVSSRLTRDSVIFGNAVNYMYENYNQNLNVPDIASHLNVSLSHLKRIF